jgi:hypothetical protein
MLAVASLWARRLPIDAADVVRSSWEDRMDIGEPRKIIEVEPATIPVPETIPMPQTEPASEPVPVAPEEPVSVPRQEPVSVPREEPVPGS